jgi:chaperonin cofactor prefoldin
LTSDSADAQESLSAELERSKASVARLLKERDDLEDKLKQVGKELKQAINEKSVQVG